MSPLSLKRPGRFQTSTAIGESATPLPTVSPHEYLIPGIEAINEENQDFCEKLAGLREEPFFRLYSVDMLASCEYIPQELFECYSETCEIYPVDEEDVSCIGLPVDPWQCHLTDKSVTPTGASRLDDGRLR